MSYLSIVFSVCIIASQFVAPAYASANWTQWTAIASSRSGSSLPSLPTLPRSDFSSALCYNESLQTFHIIGGRNNGAQWVDFDVAQNVFVDHGESALPTNLTVQVEGTSGQYYEQMNGVLYWMFGHEPMIGTNMEIHAMNVVDIGQSNSLLYWQNVPPTYNTHSYDHCLTSHGDKLIVVGGLKVGVANQGVRNIAIYDFTAGSWMSGLPLMQEPRQKVSCVVNTADNTLYVAGGNHVGALATIEKVPLTDIATQSFAYTSGNLVVAVYGHFSIYSSADNAVLAIGGFDGSIARNEIQRIDCATGSVSVIGTLDYAVARSAFIYIPQSNLVYMFGGEVTLGTGTDMVQIIEGVSPLSSDEDPTTLSPLAPDTPTASPTTSEPSTTKLPTLAPTPTVVKTFALNASWSCLYSTLFVLYNDEPLLNVNALTENVCSQIFDQDTANLLGEDAVCSWSLDEEFIRVSLAPSSTIGTADVIGIKSGVFEGYNSNGQRFTNDAVEIASIAAECSDTAPVVHLYVPPQIGACDGLDLDIRGDVISNLGLRSAQTIDWQITLNEPSETLSFSDTQVSLLASQIDANQTFSVTLTVTSWYGASTTISGDVNKPLFSAIPSVTMLYPSVYDVHTNVIELDNLITLNDECISGSDATAPQFGYAWSVQAISDDNETVPAQLSVLVDSNTDRRLIIDDVGALLQKGAAYEFTLTVDCGTGCQVSQPARISYKYSPITCQISGGDQAVSASLTQLSDLALTLVGDEWTFDPEASALSYAWQCSELVHGVSCDDLIESPSAATTRVVFASNAATFVVNSEYQFEFRMVVSDSGNSARSSCSQTKHVTLSIAEDEVEAYLVQLSSTAISISSADRLRLIASVTTLQGDNVSDDELVYVWSEQNGWLTSAHIANYRLNDATANNLVLSGGDLQTGTIYVFVLNVYQATDVSTSLGASSISIYVKSPPVISEFVVENTNGESSCSHQFDALLDSFSHSFDLVVSADGDYKPFSYAFKADSEYLHSHVLDQWYLNDVLLPIDCSNFSLSVAVADFEGAQATQSMDCCLSVVAATSNNCFSYQTDVLDVYLNANPLSSVSAKYRFISQSTFNLLHYLPNINNVNCVGNHFQETLAALDVYFGSGVDLCAANSEVFVTGVAHSLKKWLTVGLQESLFSSAASCTADPPKSTYFDVVSDLLTQILDPCQTLRETVTDTDRLSVSPESVRTNQIMIFYEDEEITNSLSLLLTQPLYFDLFYDLINVFFDFLSASSHCGTTADMQQSIAFLQKAIYVNGLSGIATTIPSEFNNIVFDNFEVLTIREEQISEVSVSVKGVPVTISVGGEAVITDIVFYGLVAEPVPGTVFAGCNGGQSQCAGILSSQTISVTIPDNHGTLDIAIALTFEYPADLEPVCVWWDELSEIWDTSGCGVSEKDEDAGTVVCLCTHLTTFATISILKQQDPFIADLGFEHWGYIMLVFIAVFAGIFGWIMFNFWRLTTFGAPVKSIFKHRAMQILLSISLVALFYALQGLLLLIASVSFASDGSQHDKGLAAVLIILLLLPLIIYYKIFAFLIGTWINVVHSMNKTNLVRRLKKSIKWFTIAVFLVYTTLIILLLSFRNSDNKSVARVIKIAELTWTVIMCLSVITYTVYGARIIQTLNHAHVTDETTAALKRIFISVVGLNVFFLLQGAQTIYFSVYPDRLNIAWKFADLSLNALCLLLMCYLYSRAFQSVLSDDTVMGSSSRKRTRGDSNASKTLKTSKSAKPALRPGRGNSVETRSVTSAKPASSDPGLAKVRSLSPGGAGAGDDLSLSAGITEMAHTTINIELPNVNAEPGSLAAEPVTPAPVTPVPVTPVPVPPVPVTPVPVTHMHVTPEPVTPEPGASFTGSKRVENHSAQTKGDSAKNSAKTVTKDARSQKKASGRKSVDKGKKDAAPGSTVSSLASEAGASELDASFTGSKRVQNQSAQTKGDSVTKENSAKKVTKDTRSQNKASGGKSVAKGTAGASGKKK